MSLPESHIKLVKVDCPEDKEPNFRTTLAVTDSIYFEGDGKYYQIDPKFGTAPGYVMDEETKKSWIIVPEHHIIFISVRTEFKHYGAWDCSVFKVNPEKAEKEGSGMMRVDAPEDKMGILTTKNSLTPENASSIIKGHLNFLHRTEGKHPFLNVNLNPDCSFSVDDDEAPKLRGCFRIDV